MVFKEAGALKGRRVETRNVKGLGPEVLGVKRTVSLGRFPLRQKGKEPSEKVGCVPEGGVKGLGRTGKDIGCLLCARQCVGHGGGPFEGAHRFLPNALCPPLASSELRDCGSIGLSPRTRTRKGCSENVAFPLIYCDQAPWQPLWHSVINVTLEELAQGHLGRRPVRVSVHVCVAGGGGVGEEHLRAAPVPSHLLCPLPLPCPPRHHPEDEE